MNNIYHYILLITAIALSAVGQIFLKMGADRVKAPGLSYYIHVAMNRYIIIAFLVYGLSFALWIRALRYFDVSYARPLASLGFVLTYFLAVVMLGEELTFRRIAGTVIITVGVFLIK